MSMSATQYVKVAFIGDSGVGKTSLIKAFMGETVKDVKSTIGIDNYIFTKDGIKIVIWDFAGQRWFLEILINLLKGASIIVLVFDQSEPKTLTNIVKFWIPNLEKYSSSDSFIILVGNKKDIKKISDEILIKFIDKIKEKIDVQIFLQTSAKLNENVKNLFYSIFEIVKMIKKVDDIKKSKK